MSDRGTDFSKTDPQKRNALHYAVKQNAIRNAIWLCSHAPNLINQPDINGETPLHLAVRLNYLHIARGLLNAGADYSLGNAQGKTPEDLAETIPMRVLLFLATDVPGSQKTLWDYLPTESLKNPRSS